MVTKLQALITALLIWLPLTTTPVRAEAVKDEQASERAAIARVIDNSIGWFATKDFDLLFSALADDADFFIFHPDSQSTIRGAGAFRRHCEVFRNPDLTYAGHEIHELRIGISRARDTAWFSALLDDCSESKGQRSCWRDCRWTGSLEKREGRWVIVQMHFSFAEEAVDRAARQSERDRSARVFGTYQQMRGAVVELFQQQRHAEAAAILAGAIARYPDHVMANSFNLALMYAMLGNGEEAVRALEDGHRRGIFYGKWSFQGAPWDTLFQLASFRQVLARNDELIAAAQETTTMKLDVVLPSHYTAGRAYPLLLALHGGGENIAQFKPRWTSARLREEFIVAYVQSSQVAAVDGYHWQDDAITRKEVRQAFREVVAAYAVDTTRVVVGGFSSGGYGTLVTTLDGTLPATAFIVLCPEIPDDLNRAGVERAARRGVRGTLLTTELDGRLDRQRHYAEQLSANGLAVRFIVTPNIGHWYPDDLEQLIDEALAHIEARPSR